MRIIKRYKNRRLYDAEGGQAITLRGVARLVKDDVPFRVVDSATGRETTLAVLIGVLGDELHDWGNAAETGKLIRLLIREGGNQGVTILNKTLLAAIGAISLTRENAEKLVDELIKRGELGKSRRAEAIKEALEKAEAKSRQVAGKIKATVQAAKQQTTFARATDLEALNKKVDRLTKMVEDLKARLETS